MRDTTNSEDRALATVAPLESILTDLGDGDLGGQVKSGHVWPLQNRPQDKRSGQGFLLLHS